MKGDQTTALLIRGKLRFPVNQLLSFENCMVFTKDENFAISRNSA